MIFEMLQVTKSYACHLTLRMWTWKFAAHPESFDIIRNVPPESVLLAENLRAVLKIKDLIAKAEETLQRVTPHRE
jgi:hypothetical protein